MLVATQTYFALLFFQGVVTNYVGLVNRLGMTGQYTRIHQEEVEKETRLPFESFFCFPWKLRHNSGRLLLSPVVSSHIQPGTQESKPSSRVAVSNYKFTPT